MVYDPFANPENVYAPEALAVVVAVAVPVNATVAPLPVVPTPPVIVQVDAAMLSEKVLTMLAALAVTIAVCEVGTVAATEAENPAFNAPAATVTLAGTVNKALLLDKATTNPPVKCRGTQCCRTRGDSRGSKACGSTCEASQRRLNRLDDRNCSRNSGSGYRITGSTGDHHAAERDWSRGVQRAGDDRKRYGCQSPAANDVGIRSSDNTRCTVGNAGTRRALAGGDGARSGCDAHAGDAGGRISHRPLDIRGLCTA